MRETQPQNPADRHWSIKIQDEPIRWIQFRYSELEEVIAAADRYGDTALLNKARAALKRRDEDTRPQAAGFGSPYARSS